MLLESSKRIFFPEVIYFDQAIIVAVIGLLVNIVSAFLLKDSHHGDHAHSHHHDHNLKAAYFHVLADAMTSLLAIIALLAGKYMGWNWLDPVAGIVGGIVIIYWSSSLLRRTTPILLDTSIQKENQLKIKEILEKDSDNKITDIHIWKIAEHHYAAVISLVTHFPKTVDYYKKLLNGFHQISHLTIEVNQCNSEPCFPEKQ
jgi:cation diffusion facilitator family transporter